MIKMTDNSIKEIKQVYDLMINIMNKFPFGYSESWRIAEGKKNGKKREICGILSFDYGAWKDFETDEISIGISISTTARTNLHGETVHYPVALELGKAALLKALLSEGLNYLKLKYFEIEISECELEDDGDNGWEHWMGYDLTPIQSVFEKEKEEETRKRHELHVRIYDTVEKMPLTEENIKKLLKFDNEISGFDRLARISDHRIYDYGKMKNPDYIDDTIPCSMTFKEYLNHFYASSCWGIEGYGYDEKDADEISKMFDDLKLDLGDKMDYENIRKTMIEKTKNMEMTKENMEKIIAFENETYKNIGVGVCTYEINEEKQTIKLISGPNDLDWEVVEEVYPIPFQGYIEKLCRCIAADIDDEMLKEVMRDFNNLELKYRNEIKTLNKEDLVNKLLDEADIERMEQKGWIGPDKSFKENSGHFNDVFLETIWENELSNFWDAIVNEATKRYMESLPVEKKEETREEIIDKIIESCEEDLTRNAVKKVCEWLVENSKYIRQHLLCVGDIQHYINGNIHHVGGVFLYAETDGDDTIIDLDTWAYYEKKGEGDNFSKEELKELYEKL